MSRDTVVYFLVVTWRVLPLDKILCGPSELIGWLSLNHVILGAGFPSTWHSRWVVLLMRTVTSSGKSLSVPRMDGGTVAEKKCPVTDCSVLTEWYLKHKKCFYSHNTLTSYWMESSPASFTATHVYRPVSSAWALGICNTRPPEDKQKKMSTNTFSVLFCFFLSVFFVCLTWHDQNFVIGGQ